MLTAKDRLPNPTFVISPTTIPVINLPVTKRTHGLKILLNSLFCLIISKTERLTGNNVGHKIYLIRQLWFKIYLAPIDIYRDTLEVRSEIYVECPL